MITDYFLKRCIWTNILSGLNQYDLSCVLPTTVEYIIDLIMKTDREMMLHNNLELLNHWLMSLLQHIVR